mmetsp:Transcript_96152/g.206295  ORF Transcript_96152/g.206295 Transcript_96152/m.206295 type:complete len:188 (-) Transcript_96152:33-596(-)
MAAHGARMAKLQESSERLISGTVGSIMNEDLRAVLGTALPPSVDTGSWLPQAQARMAANFAEAARLGQAEALQAHHAADVTALLDAQHYGLAASSAQQSFYTSVERGAASTATAAPQPPADLRDSMQMYAKKEEVAMIRQHLRDQLSDNEKQEKDNASMRAELQALMEKLDVETLAIEAQVAVSGGA